MRLAPTQTHSFAQHDFMLTRRMRRVLGLDIGDQPVVAFSATAMFSSPRGSPRACLAKETMRASAAVFLAVSAVPLQPAAAILAAISARSLHDLAWEILVFCLRV